MRSPAHPGSADMKSARKTTLAAVLTAVALILFIVEALLPPLLPVPGVKLGLSNVITLFALYVLGPGMAFLILLCRIVLGGLLTGQVVSMLYSLSGGLLSFAVCACVYRFFPRRQAFVLSMISAVLHNTGQIAMAALMTSAAIFAYLPILTVSGILTGLFTGLCAQFVLMRQNPPPVDPAKDKCPHS